MASKVRIGNAAGGSDGLPADACQQLFQAVLARAFIDAGKRVPQGARERHEDEDAKLYRLRSLDAENKRMIAKRVRKQARDWLLSGSQDFHLVCAFAGVDSDYVYERAQNLAAQGWRHLQTMPSRFKTLRR